MPLYGQPFIHATVGAADTAGPSGFPSNELRNDDYATLRRAAGILKGMRSQ
jgi:hypothetical protein